MQIFLGISFILFLAYNMVIALELKYEADGDAWDYIHLGLSVAKTGKYGHLDSSREQLLNDLKYEKIKNTEYNFIGSTAFRPPIWPFLIAGIFLVFGYNLIFVLVFKFLLHLLGVFIFYKTLKLLKLKDILIVIGAFLYGISPAWQLYSRVFLSEPITLFFITLWLYLLIRFVVHKSSWWPQAIIAGVLVLCHPYYIFLPFSIWFILFIKKKLKIKILIFSSVICIAVISVWVIRNFIVMETNEIILTTSSGAVMAKGWNSKVVKNHTNTKGDLADEGLVLKEFEYDKNIGYKEVERMQLYKDATLDFIRSNPELILPIIGKKLLSAFNPFPETPRSGILETGRWLFQFLALLSLIYILFFSRNKLIQSLAIGLILSTIGISILTYSGFRFRMPQAGLEMLFIIFVIDDILKRNKFHFNFKIAKTI
ncbi:glycosyltransferase family 39 protein [Gillisia mitskevichiae]|uniref:glycosyltransferase family 39 protein n=1 Tax=Gillisia mitskevichiae TaxID=270921 RepID=UPI001602CAD4|nr:glycosyltransferase family 39 protein [Gillisia mitskevichiae]